jgi:hypothetical protein
LGGGWRSAPYGGVHSLPGHDLVGVVVTLDSVASCLKGLFGSSQRANGSSRLWKMLVRLVIGE